MTLVEGVISEARKIYDRDASMTFVASAVDHVTTRLAPNELATLCVEVMAMHIQIRMQINASGTVELSYPLFYALNESIAVLMYQRDNRLRAIESKRAHANIRNE